MTTSGGKNAGAPRAVSVIEPRQPLFEEALPPEAGNFAAGIQSFGNLIVAQSLCGEEDDLCTLNLKIR
jgi:hypothetical protein